MRQTTDRPGERADRSAAGPGSNRRRVLQPVPARRDAADVVFRVNHRFDKEAGPRLVCRLPKFPMKLRKSECVSLVTDSFLRFPNTVDASGVQLLISRRCAMPSVARRVGMVDGKMCNFFP